MIHPNGLDSFFHDVVLHPSTMRISVLRNILELEDPKKSWSDHFQKLLVRLHIAYQSPS